MADIILFHSILGLRPIELSIADKLAQDGHRVDVPDLFEGRTSHNYVDAFALKEKIGEAIIVARARAAVDAASSGVVLVGVSYGAFLIGDLWQDRASVRGALLLCGIAPWMTPRTVGLPVSAHVARPDPFDEEEVFSSWAADRSGVDLDLHRYDAVGHYFLDPSLPDHDPAAAELCMARARDFLARFE